MEDTLGGCFLLWSGRTVAVLILVFVEDALGEVQSRIWHIHRLVLILVLMEDTLGDIQCIRALDRNKIFILVMVEDTLVVYYEHQKTRALLPEVLILVLVEDTLGA